jgi:predicted transcriptional regulator
MPLDPQKIRERRERLSLTQSDAAERAGMPQPHWARIESGERNDPALSTAERVAKALRCSIAKLLQTEE